VLEWSFHSSRRYADPFNKEHGLGTVRPDASGDWPVPHPPEAQDWVLVLEADPPPMR
jgi:hypothetical protein